MWIGVCWLGNFGWQFTKQIANGDLVPSIVREAIHVVEEKWLRVV